METNTLTALYPDLAKSIELLNSLQALIELTRKDLAFDHGFNDVEFLQAVRVAYPPRDFAAAHASITARIEADCLATKYALIGGGFELVQRLHRAARVKH